MRFSRIIESEVFWNWTIASVRIVPFKDWKSKIKIFIRLNEKAPDFVALRG